MQVLVGAFSCISIALAFAADVTPPQHRGAVFGFIMGSFSFGVVVGAAHHLCFSYLNNGPDLAPAVAPHPNELLPCEPHHMTGVLTRPLTVTGLLMHAADMSA